MHKFKQVAVFFVSLTMLIWVFAMIPTVAGAIPEELAYILTEEVSIPPYTVVEDTSSEDGEFLLSEEFGSYETSEISEESEEELSDEVSIDLSDAKFVQAVSLCWYGASDTPRLDIINNTSYKVNLNTYASAEYSFVQTKNPTVLIVHTHGTESYLGAGIDYYFDDEKYRSSDPEIGVVGVGRALKSELEKLGISVIHDETMYDAEDYNSAYTSSRKGIQAALASSSDIVMVIDLHRDSVFTSSGVNQKPVCNIDGTEYAQIMLVVGTNAAGAAHPNWKTNLTMAVHLQSTLNELYPTLARPICLRKAAYNQALHSGSVLIEVGACGNTIEEAKNSTVPLAEAIAKLIKG